MCPKSLATSLRQVFSPPRIEKCIEFRLLKWFWRNEQLHRVSRGGMTFCLLTAVSNVEGLHAFIIASILHNLSSYQLKVSCVVARRCLYSAIVQNRTLLCSVYMTKDLGARSYVFYYHRQYLAEKEELAKYHHDQKKKLAHCGKELREIKGRLLQVKFGSWCLSWRNCLISLRDSSPAGSSIRHSSDGFQGAAVTIMKMKKANLKREHVTNAFRLWKLRLWQSGMMNSRNCTMSSRTSWSTNHPQLLSQIGEQITLHQVQACWREWEPLYHIWRWRNFGKTSTR